MKSFQEIGIGIPYDIAVKAYLKLAAIEEEEKKTFDNAKAQARSSLESLLKDFDGSQAEDVTKIFGNLLRLTIEPTSLLGKQCTAVDDGLRAYLQGYQPGQTFDNQGVLALLDSIEPFYWITSGPYDLDLGAKRTANVMTADSSAKGKDPRGRPMPGQLTMYGFSLTDLVKNTDFIGATGIMFKGSMLTREERPLLQEYMISKAIMDERDRRSILETVVNIKDRRPKEQAQLLMGMASMATLRLAEIEPFIDLQVLSMKGTAEEKKEKADALFYQIADAGIILGGRIMTTSAFALRELLKAKGVSGISYEMPNAPDPNLSWGGNFLRYLYGVDFVNKDGFANMAKAMDDYFQIIRTHGAGNASTYATRIAGGAHASLYNSINVGISVLSGERHGFANFLVYEQLEPIYRKLKASGITDEKIREEAEAVYKKEGTFNGIGHPVYTSGNDETPGDPRVGVMVNMIKSWDDPELNEKLDFYQRWEKHAVAVLEREKPNLVGNFSANVDFYSAFLLQDRIGLPIEANPLMFEIGRFWGHLSNYMEAIQFGIIRSRAMYVGQQGLKLDDTIN